MVALRRCSAFILCALFSLVAASVLAEASAFTSADLNVNALAVGATPSEAGAALGNPLTLALETVAATGAQQETWQYDRLTLTWTDGRLTGAAWVNPSLTGPRGLRVGDSRATVLEAFYRDAASADPAILYAAGDGTPLSSPLPPCGYLQAGADVSAGIVYRAPLSPYPQSVLDDPASYVFEIHATLTFQLDPVTDTVIAIHWEEGALAE